jgi:hypothetical protein
LFRARHEIAEQNLHFQENPGTGWGAVNVSPVCSTTSNFRVLSKKNVSEPSNLCAEEPQTQNTQQKWQSMASREQRDEEVHLMHLSTVIDVAEAYHNGFQ